MENRFIVITFDNGEKARLPISQMIKCNTQTNGKDTFVQISLELNNGLMLNFDFTNVKLITWSK